MSCVKVKNFIIFIFIMITSFLFLIGCAAPQRDRLSGDEVIRLIDALPNEITLDDELYILYVIDAYNSLSSEEKAKVYNIQKLIDLENKLKDLNAIDSVIAKIQALPENIVLAHKDLVVSAREAYDALTSNQKKLITNYDKLVKAEEKIFELEEIKKDQEAAKKVYDLIAFLEKEEISLIYANYIEYARVKYNSLTLNQKQYVTNLDVLVNLEKKIEDLKDANDNQTSEEEIVIIEQMIEKLPSEITLENKDLFIITYNNYFDKLSTTQKELVANIEKLTNALEYIQKLEKANVVIELINLLPDTLNEDALELINKIIEEYEKLDEDTKALVINYGIFQEKIKNLKITN